MRFGIAVSTSVLIGETVGAAATLTRGPYLQQGTPGGVTVRWRTDTSEGSFVRLGTNFAAWPRTNGSATAVTEHIVVLTNLLPNTKYFYQVGSGSNWFATTTNQYVITAPPVGTRKPTRIWALGDPGTANANQAASRDSYFAYNSVRPTDVWLMLGDNAYNSGTDAEYQEAVFDFYPTMLRNTVLWPTIGNHDAITDSASPYLHSFHLSGLGDF
jgi:phosphodiesterase/alkaline phosphatase D-like protein